MNHMGWTHYIDESGHGGDLVRGRLADAFSGQPILAVASVGYPDSEKAEWTARLAARRGERAQRDEAKSDLWKRNPQVAQQLIRDVLDAGLPWCLEIVDKRFFLCIHLFNHLVVGPEGSWPTNAQDQFARSRLAERLYDIVRTETLESYCQACLEPGHDTLRFAFNEVLGDILRAHPDDRAEALRELTAESLQDYLDLCANDPLAHRRFLPVPDLGPKDKEVWVLPNLSCFTNVYARINRHHGRDLRGVRLVHDKQRYVEEIVRQAKADAEGLSRLDGTPYTPIGDYGFEASATLEFADSADHAGLQLADLLAGFAMRFVRDVRAGRSLSPDAKLLMRRLLELSDGSPSTGVVLVTTSRAFALVHKAVLWTYLAQTG